MSVVVFPRRPRVGECWTLAAVLVDGAMADRPAEAEVEVLDFASDGNGGGRVWLGYGELVVERAVWVKDWVDWSGRNGQQEMMR